MLKDLDIEYCYTTGEEKTPLSFFAKALPHCSFLQLGLGYFSTASFNVLSCGFAHFIANDGCMQLYINQNLTKEDYELFKNNNFQGINDSLISSYHRLKNTFSKRDIHFFKCLSYLINCNRIEVKIVVLNNGGIAHQKYGILSDTANNKVIFSGSMNFTASALSRNIETINCICSWSNITDRERVAQQEKTFNNMWNGENSNTMVFLAQEFCNEIQKEYPVDTIDQLILEEDKLIKEIEESTSYSDTPHFPNNYSPYDYQEAAYKSWVNNNKNGIFAMATGTGKTITSLNAVLHEYNETNFYHVLILVPTTVLVEQWIDDVKAFNFKNIINISSANPSWRKDLIILKNDITSGIKRNFVLVSTYDSFKCTDFQYVLSCISSDMILIADEAHNIGENITKKIFRELTIPKRIALSATPKRIYDEEGSKEIETFFNDKYPYVYNFSMKEAIEQDRLMQYEYYVRIAYLNEEEMTLYMDISQKLAKLYDEITGEYTNEKLAEYLRLKRKRILYKAEDKFNVFRTILNEIGEEHLKYCFVYSPEGDYSHNQENEEPKSCLQTLINITKEVYPRISCNMYISADNANMRKSILRSFIDGKINMLYAMKCLDEGVDVPRAEYGIFVSSTGNPRQFIQRRGRLLRKHPDKAFAKIYDIVVAPDINTYNNRNNKAEYNLVYHELERVAYFANLALNKFSGTIDVLEKITKFYGINLAKMIQEINQ